jgi:hypothetical protein
LNFERYMRRLVLAVVLALMSSVAGADGGSPPPGMTPPTHVPASDTRSPTTAVVLSAGTTLLGMAMIAGESDRTTMFGVLTMYVGPTTGLWYAGNVGWPGLVARLVAAGLIVKGLEQWDNAYLAADCIEFDEGECDDSFAYADRENRRGGYLVWSGVGIWATSTIVDVALAHRAARKWNERNVTVVPTFNGGPGVALGMRF